jgi:Domain of unknown function (DUF1707)/Domain of unknown function (DUF4333)
MMQPGSSYPDSTRANDAERAEVCTLLDSACADGELDADEYRQRCSSAMSAKTRGQLLGLISDLQAGPPSFARAQATAGGVHPKRTPIAGLAIGTALAGAGAAAIAVYLATWHGDSKPSPTTTVAAPAAPAAAPAGPRSTQTTGTFLPVADLVAMVSGDFQDNFGHPPQNVSCPGDLDGHVGAFERCSITDNGRRFTADLTVKAVNGTRITTNDTINEDAASPPSGTVTP